jgi:tetratricopeptide (TPR) repeat protein
MTKNAKSPQPYGWTMTLVGVVIFGMAATVCLHKLIDSHSPVSNSAVEEEQLYITSNAAHYLSLGFRGFVADWYWMRSLQYVGKKIMSVPQEVEIDDLGQLNLKLLAPLLDIATTLDPEFVEPYEYASMILPAVDLQEAIRITKKGIELNPTAWRLYQQLGFIYWQHGDFRAAGEVYGRGAQLPGAPPWMEAMKARMAAEGGSRTTAREIYLRMYQESADTSIKEMARRRLLQIESFEQRDLIRKVFSAYRERVGHCPASWKEIAGLLKASGLKIDHSAAPLDPGGTPYLLNTGNCDVDLDQKSEVPSK